MAAAKKTVPTNAEVAAAFRVIADWVELTGGPSTSPASGGDVEKLNEEDVKALSLTELRDLAKELELDEQKVKKGILDELAAKGYFADEDEDDTSDEDEPEDDEDEDDTEEEDEEDEEELSREDLEDMDLKELRDMAKEEGHPRASYVKADKDALIDLLMGDEDEEDEEEDEDGDEEETELSEEDIRAMSLAEVKELAKELGVKVPPSIAKNRKKIADKILEEMAEEE
ncbi:hypothetical protein GCM10010423_65480 [Streptomyces levis]|uniref:Rho termination factor-like N-terminal domain-containing protein n=1 Tax=Streptomyces levis TaxID=285566 RepID=A0ABN3P333_9ACTN